MYFVCLLAREVQQISKFVLRTQTWLISLQCQRAVGSLSHLGNGSLWSCLKGNRGWSHALSFSSFYAEKNDHYFLPSLGTIVRIPVDRFIVWRIIKNQFTESDNKKAKIAIECIFSRCFQWWSRTLDFCSPFGLINKLVSCTSATNRYICISLYHCLYDKQ